MFVLLTGTVQKLTEKIGDIGRNAGYLVAGQYQLFQLNLSTYFD